MYLSQAPVRMSVIARPKFSGSGEHWGVLIPGVLIRGVLTSRIRPARVLSASPATTLSPIPIPRRDPASRCKGGALPGL